MRKIAEHRRAGGPDFDAQLRALVRNAPWWSASLVAHAVVLLLLATLRMPQAPAQPVAKLRATPETSSAAPEELLRPEREPTPETEPTAPIDRAIEVPEQEASDDSDREDLAPQGFEGPTSGPLSGSFANAVIGPGGGAGGGQGPGGRRRQPGPKDPARPEADHAVELALRWLAIHQDLDADGRWDCDGFMRHDPSEDRCDGAGAPHYDAGVTGLALLAFLGAGYTDRGVASENPFARNVRQGLRFLVSIQDEEGCFGSRASQHFMYNHAIATLAVCEAFWMTRNPGYRSAAQRGLDFLAQARNPYMAWRYHVRGGENDTSVTGWCVMALKSGKFAGLEIDPEAFEGARQWIEAMTDPDTGKVGYTTRGGPPARPAALQDRFPAERSESMTAVGVMTRVFLGEDPRSSEAIRKGAELLSARPPVWDPDGGSIDMYYWYYGTLAMFQVGGEPWRKWNRAMLQAIVASQHPKDGGAKAGSWDPIDPWGADGGRVYATAALCTCLEVYYRYDRVFPYR